MTTVVGQICLEVEVRAGEGYSVVMGEARLRRVLVSVHEVIRRHLE